MPVTSAVILLASLARRCGVNRFISWWAFISDGLCPPASKHSVNSPRAGIVLSAKCWAMVCRLALMICSWSLVSSRPIIIFLSLPSVFIRSFMVVDMRCGASKITIKPVRVCMGVKNSCRFLMAGGKPKKWMDWAVVKSLTDSIVVSAEAPGSGTILIFFSRATDTNHLPGSLMMGVPASDI